MDRSVRQKLNRGYADGLSRGIEIALVPVVFGGIGWLLDRQFGTAPLFTLGLVVFAFVGTMIKLWIGYDADMRREEAGAIWNRGKNSPLATAPSGSATGPAIGTAGEHR